MTALHWVRHGSDDISDPIFEDDLRHQKATSLKINKWREQVNAKNKISISRKALVNWLLDRIPETLSKSEINAIVDSFYDENKLIRRIPQLSKEAKARGEILEIILRSRKAEEIGEEEGFSTSAGREGSDNSSEGR
ncbi:MAG TPA: hypothetical protein VN132_05010 [Bdellovibrio sp.]|nr:hypothetical protein [Bdellovibrio sp.]